MKSSVMQVILLIVVSATIFFTNLGTARLWDRDEPRNAGCAAEMQARGDWVVPTFNDELRHQKPVLLYWLIMSAYSVFGQTEFAARFWSAVLAIGTVLCCYGIARRLAGPRLGLCAGVILSSSFMFDVAARAATPDSVLIFCSTLALLCYILGTFSESASSDAGASLRQTSGMFPVNPGWITCMYAAMAFGVLAKGPVGFLIPMAIIGLFMLIQRMPATETAAGGWLSWISRSFKPFHPFHFLKTLWAMRPLTGAAIVLLLAAPWYVLVDARTDGDFTRLFFVGEHLGRATTAMENHSGGIWYYPLAILVGFFPWSIFWVPVTIACIRKHRFSGLSAIEIFSLCWIGVQVGIFSIAQTKLPSYVTPCYPALALLTATFLADWVADRRFVSDGWMKAAFAALVMSGLGIAAGLGFAAHQFFPDQIWLVAIGIVPVLGALLAWWQLGRGHRVQTVGVAMATAVLFSWILFGFGTVAVDSAQRSDVVLGPIAEQGGDQIVASYRGLESSWVFYAQRPILECFAARGPDADASLQRENWWDKKPRVSPDVIVRNHANALFLTTDEFVAELLSQLPAEYHVAATTDYFLRDKKIVLIERGNPSVATQIQQQPEDTLRLP